MRRQRPRRGRPAEQRDELAAVPLDHLVGKREQAILVRRGQATCAVLRLMTSSNLVDCSTGNSAGFAPLENLSSIDTEATMAIEIMRAIAHEPPGVGIGPTVVDRGNTMACCQRDDLIAAGAAKQRIVRHQERGVTRFDERGKGSINVLIAAGIENSDLLPDRARSPLDVF